ncbi:Dirigent protein 25 [Zea mays]|uniref:Dirigent protein n=2 Tax=Zea mays TaxID=4577 RepID=A0A3L6FK11_MAIZE|nr:dirigent-like protein [Zea mays]PWZ33190.1 Dirigent protein 25 [Zea mays]
MAFKKAAIGLSSLLLILVLLLVAPSATAARPTRQLTSDDDDDGTGAAAPAAAPAIAHPAADAPVTADASPPVVGGAGVVAAPGGAVAADAPVAANAIPAAAAAAPVAASTIPVGAGAGAAGAGAAGGGADGHGMVFFMHDILGGTNPSARIVAGIVDNAAVTGQLPFARPNGAVLPLNSGVNVNSGAAGAIDNNNIPFLTGLGGATNAAKSVGSNGNGNGNGVPVFAGGSLPQGTTLQKLLFGTMTVVDDELTEAPELGSAAVGRAQGFYIASSEEGVSQTVAVTAMFKEGGFDDTVSFFGVHRTADSESHLAVVGGTGKYVGAKGFAKVAVVRPGGVAASGALLETDGVESVLQFTVFLV